MMYPWQSRQWLQLQAQIREQRLPHAILLAGPNGLGKLDFANQLAAGLLCKSPDNEGHACGQCDACKLLAAGTHPDYLLVAPEAEDKAIKVDDVRELCRTLSLTSQYGGYTVAVIAFADNMNINAANSLLKTLEEPTDNSILILVSSRPHRFPITIRSRCQTIHFDTPDTSDALQWLESQEVNNPEVLLRLAHGSPLLAIRLSEEDLLEQRKTLLQALIGAARTKQVTEYAESLSKWPGEYLLGWLYDLISDLLKLKQCGKAVLVHEDYHKELSQFSSQTDTESLYNLLDEVILLIRTQTIPLNSQMLWEDLLISWQRLQKRA